MMSTTENLLTFMYMYMYVDYLTWNKHGFATTVLKLDNLCSDVTGYRANAWPHLESVLQLYDLLVCSDVTCQCVDADVMNLLLQQLLVTLQSVRLCAEALKT